MMTVSDCIWRSDAMSHSQNNTFCSSLQSTQSASIPWCCWHWVPLSFSMAIHSDRAWSQCPPSQTVIPLPLIGKRCLFKWKYLTNMDQSRSRWWCQHHAVNTAILSATTNNTRCYKFDFRLNPLVFDGDGLRKPNWYGPDRNVNTVWTKIQCIQHCAMLCLRC